MQIDLSKVEEIAISIAEKKRVIYEDNIFTFSSMAAHVGEIKDLLKNDNSHWKDEVVDLMIHCLILLRRYNVSRDDIEKTFDKRFGRFKHKIGEKK